MKVIVVDLIFCNWTQPWPPSDKSRTECDGRDPSEELFRGSDRGGEKESEGICGGLNS